VSTQKLIFGYWGFDFLSTEFLKSASIGFLKKCLVMVKIECGIAWLYTGFMLVLRKNQKMGTLGGKERV
jgi:hypothetical protein